VESAITSIPSVVPQMVDAFGRAIGLDREAG
jgi:hypothetical protein